MEECPIESIYLYKSLAVLLGVLCIYAAIKLYKNVEEEESHIVRIIHAMIFGAIALGCLFVPFADSIDYFCNDASVAF